MAKNPERASRRMLEQVTTPVRQYGGRVRRVLETPVRSTPRQWLSERWCPPPVQVPHLPGCGPSGDLREISLGDLDQGLGSRPRHGRMNNNIPSEAIGVRPPETRGFSMGWEGPDALVPHSRGGLVRGGPRTLPPRRGSVTPCRYLDLRKGSGRSGGWGSGAERSYDVRLSWSLRPGPPPSAALCMSH
jgi:hypothetical protein